MALCRMEQGQVDCGFFQETNLTKIVYIREDSVFWVMEMEAQSAYRGGV